MSLTKWARENKDAERLGLRTHVGTGSISVQGFSTIVWNNYYNCELTNIHGTKNFISIRGIRNSPTSVTESFLKKKIIFYYMKIRKKFLLLKILSVKINKLFKINDFQRHKKELFSKKL